MSTESKTPTVDELRDRLDRFNYRENLIAAVASELEIKLHGTRAELVRLQDVHIKLANHSLGLRLEAERQRDEAKIREQQNMDAWKASELDRAELKKELAKCKPIAERSGCLMADLEDATKQKEALTRALAEQSNDAAVDSGAFTYKDWQQIRAKETLQYLRQPDDIKAEYIERLLDNALNQ